MNDRPTNLAAEVASVLRKADQSCSIHAWLRDRYSRSATLLDYGLMGATTYLLGLSLVEPAIGLPLSLGYDRNILIVAFSLFVFFLSIDQFKNDWKRRTEAHHRAFSEYAGVKSDCRVYTSGTRSITQSEYQRIRDRYDNVAEVGTHIPDKDFTAGKAHHLRKVFVSQYLDNHPGARPWVVQLKLFLRDNLNIDLLVDHAKTDDQE